MSVCVCVFIFSRTITNVEEHIKNSLISETSTSDSAFHNIKIIADSIEIKRQLDPEIVQRAVLFNEQVFFSVLMSSKNLHNLITKECKFSLTFLLMFTKIIFENIFRSKKKLLWPQRFCRSMKYPKKLLHQPKSRD